MKKMIYLIVFCFSISLSSQSLNEKNKDEFTDIEEVSTTWEVLFKKGLNPSICKYRFNQINGELRIEARIVINGGEVFAINESMPISFLLDNGDVVNFYPNDTFIAKRGGASDGFIGSNRWGSTIHYYPSNNESLKAIIGSRVQKVRVNTDIGYIEDKIKPKDQEKFQNALKMLL